MIEEQDEHDEEERKTQTDINKDTAQGPFGHTQGTNNSGPKQDPSPINSVPVSSGSIP